MKNIINKFPSENRIRYAAQYLLEGGLVSFPTETVYGLGADAEQEVAVRNLYRIKNRPLDHPVIIHIADESNVYYWVEDIPKEAYVLMKTYWPGPLTLIFKKAKHVNNIISGGQETIGIRCPSHPVAHKLIKYFIYLNKGHGGLAVPSANKFGRISPTKSCHVIEEFNLKQDSSIFLLEGSNPKLGIESTVLDISHIKESDGKPILLRPGHISMNNISSVLNCKIEEKNNNKTKYSGMMTSHYSPITRFKLISTDELQKVYSEYKLIEHDISIIHYSNLKLHPNDKIFLYKMPNDPIKFAKILYAKMRFIDSLGYDLILMEKPPTSVEWEAINDRIKRASNIK